MKRTETLLASMLDTNTFRVVSLFNSIGRILRPVPLKSATYKRHYAQGELILVYQSDTGEANMSIKVLDVDALTFTVLTDGILSIRTDHYTIELS